MSILGGIIEKKRVRLDECKAKTSLVEIRTRALDAPTPRGFSSAIRRPKGEKLRLIAEIKKASPSKGLIREDFDPAGIAGRALVVERGLEAWEIWPDECAAQAHIDASSARRAIRQAFKIYAGPLFGTRKQRKKRQ